MSNFTIWLQQGIHHILAYDAADHILYIVALTLGYTYKQWRAVLLLATAFTIGHSITLLLTALNFIPSYSVWVEFFIPLTIAATAVYKAFTQYKKNKINIAKLPYILALLFGLVHGMAYGAISVGSLYSGAEAVYMVLAFNLGVELGQVVVIIATLLLTFLLTMFTKLKPIYWQLTVYILITLYALYLAILHLP